MHVPRLLEDESEHVGQSLASKPHGEKLSVAEIATTARGENNCGRVVSI